MIIVRQNTERDFYYFTYEPKVYESVAEVGFVR
jgi:hypothetical protein